MVKDFEVEVPFEAEGDSGSGAGGSDKGQKSIGELTKSIVGGIGILKVLGSLFGDVIKLFQPLIKILSLLFFVVFLPLMPLIMSLTKGIADFIRIITGGGTEGIIAWFIGFLEAVAIILFLIFGGWILGLLVAVGLLIMAFWDDIASLFVWVWDNVLLPAITVIADGFIWAWNNLIKPVFETIASGLSFIWEGLKKVWTMYIDGLKLIWSGIKFVWDSLIKPAFEMIASGLNWVWDNLIKPVWDTITSGLKTAWEGLKSVFDWFKDGLKAVINGIIKMVNFVPGVDIPRLANGGIVTSPTLALIGEAGPEAVVPLGKGFGKTTININHPVIRDRSDIKAMAGEVSKVLMRETRGRFM